MYVCIYVCMHVCHLCLEGLWNFAAFVVLYHNITWVICSHERGMQSCMYVFMYVCKYRGLYICMYECMHVCMHVCMYACSSVCMYAGMYVHVHACMHAIGMRSWIFAAFVMLHHNITWVICSMKDAWGDERGMQSCMYVCKYRGMYVCMYVCICMYACMRVCMYGMQSWEACGHESGMRSWERHAVMKEACGHERGMRSWERHAVMREACGHERGMRSWCMYVCMHVRLLETCGIRLYHIILEWWIKHIKHGFKIWSHLGWV